MFHALSIEQNDNAARKMGRYGGWARLPAGVRNLLPWVVVIILLINTILHTIVHTDFHTIFSIPFWRENSEWIRNISLVFAVIIGAILAIWRNVVSNVASQALTDNARINNKNFLVSSKIHSSNLYLDCIKSLANHENEKSIVILHSIMVLGRFLENPQNEEYKLAIFALTRFLREIVPYNMRSADSSLTEKDKNTRDAALTALKKIKTGGGAEESVRIDLSNLDLEDADLFGFDLMNADLEDSNLSGTRLDATNLSALNLTGINLEGARLSKVNFEESNLFKANVARAKMDDAHLKGANFERASFEASGLMGSDFQGAKLGNANFKNAVVTDVNFTGAWLSDANFEGTLGLTVEQLSKAETLYGVKYLPAHIEAELRKRHAELFKEPGGLDFEEI